MRKFSEKSIAIALSVALATSMYPSVTNHVKEGNVSGKTNKNVFTEIAETTLSSEELTKIKEDALTDGASAAAEINEYDNEADFEAAVNAALTSYYGNEKYDEIKGFEEVIDERANEIINGYKEAAKERELGDANGFEVGKALVTFAAGTTKEEIEAVAAAEYGKCMSILECFDGEYLVEMEISLGHTVDMAVDAFEEYSCTQYASANDYIDVADTDVASVSEVSDDLTTVSTTDRVADSLNDKYITSQYYLDHINVKGAWDYVDSVNHNKILVGVIDTGIQMDHPDLEGMISPESIDSTDSNNPYRLLTEMDKTYNTNHGTAVAGTIVAKANNGVGVAGVASCYDNDVVEILAVQASIYYEEYKDYKFNALTFSRGINYCIEKGVKVINFSGGALGTNTTYQEMVGKATNNGIIFVCSAGNDSTDAEYFPSDQYESISVIATTSTYTMSSFSNYGMKKDVAAPGSSIYTTTTGDEVSNFNGTSFSSPITAAVVAMMCAVNSDLRYYDVRRILIATSQDIELRDKCRGGLIDAELAVKTAAQYDTTKPIDNLNYGTMKNVALNKTVTASSKQSETLYPTRYATDGDYNTKFVTTSSVGQDMVVDLGDFYAVNSVKMSFDQGYTGSVKVMISKDQNDWQTLDTWDYGTYYNIDISGWYKIARYVKFSAVDNSGHIKVKEFEVLGYEVPDEYKKPENVTGLRAYAQINGTIALWWTYNAVHNERGYRFNIYHNGQLVHNNVVNSTYTFDGTPGTHTFKVTSLYNGMESEGTETTIVIEEKETTTEVPTTTGNTYTTAGANWNNLSGWSVYFASGWAGNPTGAYTPNGNLSNFAMKINTASNAEWGVQLRSDAMTLTSGKKYKCTVKVTANMASENNIKYKEDVSHTEKLYKIVQGTNTFELEFTAGNTAQIFFDLGLAPAGLEFKITEFYIYQISDSEPTTTTVAPATTTVAPTTTAVITGDGPDEVFGQLISATRPGIIDVVWGASTKGQTYNVYVNGALATDVNGALLKNVGCALYSIPVADGTYTVRISSVLNGQESAGVTGTVTVSGSTVVATEAQTTEASTTEEPTTVAKVYTAAGANWTELPYWSTYFASGWAGNPTGEYAIGNSLSDFGVKISTASNGEWGVQLRSVPCAVEHGQTYKCVVKATANMSSSNNIKFKDDISQTEKLYKIAQGENTFEIEFTAGNTAQIFFDLGLAPAGLELVITEFTLAKAGEIEDTTDSATEVLLSEGKKATSSTVENDGTKAEYAADGNSGSRWASAFTDNEWISVDLEKICDISKVQIDWEAAYASEYALEVSTDGQNWTTVTTITNGKGGMEETQMNVSARYVRMRGIKRSTVYGYSIYELKIYGK